MEYIAHSDWAYQKKLVEYGHYFYSILKASE